MAALEAFFRRILHVRFLRQNTLVWFASVVVLFAGVTFFVYQSMQGLIEQSRWEAHTHEVLESLNDTASRLNGQAASLRGYIITSEQTYLNAYEDAAPRIQDDVEHVIQLVADNRLQETRAEALKSEIDAHLKTTGEIVAAFQRLGLNNVVGLVGGQSQKQLGNIQQSVRVMEATERELLARRQNDTENAAYDAMATDAIGLALGFILLSLVLLMVHREGRRREKSEEGLKQLMWETQHVAAMADFLQGCQNSKEAFDIIADHVSRLLPGISGGIGVLNNSHNLIQMAKSWGQPLPSTTEFAPEDCWALRRGRMHLLSKTECNPACGHLADRPGASLCISLMAHGEIAGILYLHADDPGVFDDKTLQLVRSLAEQISLTIANLKLQETLRYQSIRDPLTKLFNRRYMEVTLEREIAQARRLKQPFSIFMIDIDHFKRFNDTYGHEAGDALLMEFGKLLTNHTRGEDVACRFGGEEFLLILSGARLEDAVARAELLRAALKNLHVQYNRQPLGPVTMSVGVAEYPQHGERIEILINSADASLYYAKRNGRDRVVTANELAAARAQEVGQAAE